MNADSNRIILAGTVEQPLCYSHRIYGENFFHLMLAVRRRSGNVDYLPVTVSERLITHSPVTGERCRIEGQIRTYNEYCESEEVRIPMYDRNEVDLAGFICRTPYYRVSPLGREICDIMLASNRTHGKSDYIPCITWGRSARFCANLEVGSAVQLKGRFQSRVYRKALADGRSELRTAYEVSVVMIEMI